MNDVVLPAGYRWVATLSSDPAHAVHRATDERSGQDVAVEVFPGDPALRARLARETAQAAGLGHPYVVPVLDVGDLDGAVYTVSPFVDGPDLGTRLASGPVPDVVTVLGPVADALDLAHRSGLTHRGIGPGAIVLAQPHDVPCLRGFGIAPETGFAPRDEDLAPEQVRGAPVGPRTDVYALGALLFRCLTGRAPFVRGDAAAVRAAHLDDAPPRVGELRPDLPGGLDYVVAAAMAKDPGLRTPTCRAVVDAAAAVLGGVAVPAVPAPAGATVAGTRPGSAVAEPTLVGPAPSGTAFAPTAIGPGPNSPRPAPPRGTPRRILAVAVGLVLALGVAAVVAVPRIAAAVTPTSDDLARVPSALRSSCSIGDAAAGPAGAARVLTCQDTSVGLFDTAAAAESAYRTLLGAAPAARPGAGDCADGPGVESGYPGVGAQAGRVFCVRDGSAVRMVWLDRAARTVSSAVRSDGDAPELYRAWTGWVQVPAFPAPEEARLLGYLDAPRCRRAPAGTLDALAGLVAAIDCTPSTAAADSQTFYLFGDAESLRRAYGDDVTAAGSPSDATFCGDADGGRAAGNGEYGSPAVAGRVLCAVVDGKPTMSWTTDALLVLGRATGPDLVALKSYWNGNPGPTLRSRLAAINAAATPPFPTAPEAALLQHVPADTRPDCVRASPVTTKNLGGGRAGAVVSCLALGGADIAVYVQLPDAAALVAAVGRPVTGPDCQTLPPDFNGISTYTRPGSTGILDCGTPTDRTLRPFIDWTTDGSNIYVYAYGPTPAGLISWWQSGVAGPV